MAGEYKELVHEIAVLSRNQKVTVCTATEKITLAHADVYERNDDVLDGRSVEGVGVLIPGSAINVVYIEDADHE